MGATNFDHLTTGVSAREVYDRLVEQATYYHGNEGYNGTISTCSLGRCKLSFDKYTKTNEKKAWQFVEKEEWGNKWVADYIDLGVCEYHLLTVKKKTVGKETPTYKLKYTVKRDDFGEMPIRSNKPAVFNTKTEADAYAMSKTLETSDCYKVAKEYVLEKGDATLTETYVETKVYQSKPTIKDMKNKKLVAIHKYLFYGWASC